MTSLLDSPLIRRYFGCEVFGCNAETMGEPIHRSGLDCTRSTALRVLLSMQEPIKKGEKFLLLDQYGGSYYPDDVKTELRCLEFTAERPIMDVIHTGHLRLPTRFQPAKARSGEREPSSEAEKPCQCWPNHSYQVGPSDGCITHCPCDCHGPESNICKAKRRAEKCQHDGFRRYCGPNVYCENCNKEISDEMRKCPIGAPHDGPCPPPPAPSAERTGGGNKNLMPHVPRACGVCGECLVCGKCECPTVSQGNGDVEKIVEEIAQAVTRWAIPDWDARRVNADWLKEKIIKLLSLDRAARKS